MATQDRTLGKGDAAQVLRDGCERRLPILLRGLTRRTYTSPSVLGCRRRHSARASCSWSRNTWRGGCPNWCPGRHRLAAARPKRKRSSFGAWRVLCRVGAAGSLRSPW